MSEKRVRRKRTNWRMHNQKGVACCIPPAIGRLLDFWGKGDGLSGKYNQT